MADASGGLDAAGLTSVDLARVDLAGVAARFAARLRAEGLLVGPDRSARFAAAVTLVGPSTVRELYWCGLATLVSDPGEIPAFDRVFALVFGGLADPATARGDAGSPADRGAAPPRAAPESQRSTSDSFDAAGAQAGSSDEGAAAEAGRDYPYPALAAAAERLGGRDFASLSPGELASLIAVMRQLRLATPVRRSRRYEPGSRGRRIDLRTTLRL
ncbi:MAG: hypothetical protein L0Y54_19180, partial [Sporichthyaceae bacterium]|nr:hypothetical protein [Sporichthyaceae bacterium]